MLDLRCEDKCGGCVGGGGEEDGKRHTKYRHVKSAKTIGIVETRHLWDSDRQVSAKVRLATLEAFSYQNISKFILVGCSLRRPGR